MRSHPLGLARFAPLGAVVLELELGPLSDGRPLPDLEGEMLELDDAVLLPEEIVLPTRPTSRVTYETRSPSLVGTRLAMLTIGILDPRVALARTPAVLLVPRIPPTSTLIRRFLRTPRKLRSLPDEGREFLETDRAQSLGAPLDRFTLSSRQHVIGLAVVQEMPSRALENLPTSSLTIALCSPYVPSPPAKHPSRPGTTWSQALVSLPVTVPCVLSEN